MYPIPTAEDILATLAERKYFSKLDLSQAYNQLPLDDHSRKYTTINTPRGLFQYTRLPFGISSAPSIFQRVLENVLEGIPKTSNYLDDILVAGNSEEEHLENLGRVLSRLEEAGLRLNRSKCSFLQTSVSYLGYVIDREGIHPDPTEVTAVLGAPTPKNVSELRSFLGLVNYYGRFLPQLATTLAPLYELLTKQSTWHWTNRQRKAFQNAKEALASSQVLAHFDPSLEVELSCDASPYGLGAVLSHRGPDGTERPVAFASRSLNSTEKKYSQLDKEGLSIMFGISKFHKYIFGRQFVIWTDHKPLLGLLHEGKSIPPMASCRIQRWGLKLAGYHYTLRHRPGAEHSNADAMSRLPLDETVPPEDVPGEMILLMETLETSPVTARQIRKDTKRDPLMSQIMTWVLQGWPGSLECLKAESYYAEAQTFWHKRTELSVHDGCLLWGTRVVVPSTCRSKIATLLHEGHQGICKMKALARSYLWWPGIDRHLETIVKGCNICRELGKSPTPSPPTTMGMA